MTFDIPDHFLDTLADKLAPKIAARLDPQENVHSLPQFVNREGLERELGYAAKESWLRTRVKEGMPHRLIAGKLAFSVPEVIAWLEAHGHGDGVPFIQRRGAA